jgi:hypothetical protein
MRFFEVRAQIRASGPLSAFGSKMKASSRLAASRLPESGQPKNVRKLEKNAGFSGTDRPTKSRATRDDA